MKTRLLRWLGALALVADALAPRFAGGAVTVYGEAASPGPVITVNIYADTPDTALLTFGVQLTYDSSTLYVQSATKNTAQWYFYDGTNQIPYLDPDISMPGTVVILGAKLDAQAPLQGVTGNRVLLGTVTFGRTAMPPPPSGYWFGLYLGRSTSFANFVATDSTVLDSAMGGIFFKGVSIDPNDMNLNGLPDTWELAHFSALGVTTWDADPDGDGYNNLQEYLADTDPNDGHSYPRMTGVTAKAGGVSVRWAAGANATQYLQRRLSLDGGDAWQDLFTNPPPTTANGSFFDAFTTNQATYYRLRFAR